MFLFCLVSWVPLVSDDFVYMSMAWDWSGTFYVDHSWLQNGGQSSLLPLLPNCWETRYVPPHPDKTLSPLPKLLQIGSLTS